MTTNPYAYFDDESPEKAVPRLSVSDGGEQEPDCEPRCPITIDAYDMTVFFTLVLKTHPITATRRSLVFYNPDNRQTEEMSRDEARKKVNIRGDKITIALKQHVSYKFMCKRNAFSRLKNMLPLSRLETWLQNVDDPNEAYKMVLRNLRKRMGTMIFVPLVIYAIWSFFYARQIYFFSFREELLPKPELLIGHYCLWCRGVATVLSLFGIGMLLKNRSGLFPVAVLSMTVICGCDVLLMLCLQNDTVRVARYTLWSGLDFFYFFMILIDFLTLRRYENQLRSENGMT